MIDQLDFITSQNTTRATYFADVLLPFPLYKPFTYRIPTDLESNVKIGTRVIVQFGKKKIYTAIVYSLHKNPPKAYEAKYILEVMDHTPIVDPLHLRFWQWIADYYCCPIGTVMEAALPSNLKLESETKIQLMPHVSYQETELDDREYLVIEALEVQAELTISDLEEILNRKQVFPIIRSLHEKGLITTSEDLQQAYKPLIKTFVACQVDLEQPDERKQAFDQVKNAPKQTDLLLAYQLLHIEQ
ncbi:MAG: primosomal protein N', partial [Bacteroidetes bacterium SW_10_40_5]